MQQPGTASINRLEALKAEVQQLTDKAKRGNPLTLKATLTQLADKQTAFMDETVEVLRILTGEGMNNANTEKRQ